MRLLFSILFLLAFTPLHSENLSLNGHDFDAYQETLTFEEAQSKIKYALQKDPKVSAWYRITEKGIEIFSHPKDSKEARVEFFFKFGNKPKPKVLKKIQRARIAIDPGHFGGDLAKLEERYIQMPINTQKGIHQEIQFDEGTLAIKTAIKLKQRLEELGATVFLTRSEEGKGALKKGFSAWLQEDFDQTLQLLTADLGSLELKQKEQNYWKHQLTLSQVFRLTYNFIELEERAKQINAFKPDLTISCHYNFSGHFNQNGQTPGTDEDYTLFLVPGAFLAKNAKNEPFKKSTLDYPETRYEFVRLLVTEDLDESIRLAKITQKNTFEELQLPAGDHCAELKPLCIKNSSGIYHRNLTLCRFVHSPILYPEPFCQDNYKQAKRLSENPDALIDQMVDIYLRSICEWFDSKAL